MISPFQPRSRDYQLFSKRKHGANWYIANPCTVIDDDCRQYERAEDRRRKGYPVAFHMPDSY